MENKGCNMLLVDDEENILRSLKRLLRREDYSITMANSAEEGIEKLASKGEFHLIISDYRMPGKNGVEFLKEAKKKHPDSIRMILSGYADVAAIISAINEGQIYKFITKPWDDDELKITIRRALEQHELKSENSKLSRELRALNKDLERKVEERTMELEFRNKALLQTQEVMELLPFAVVGIDNKGVLTLINQKGKELFAETKCLLGDEVEGRLPSKVTGFLDEMSARDEKLTDGEIKIGENNFLVKLALLGPEDNPRGRVLTFVDACA